LIPGRWFSLTDTPNDLDGDWLCTGAVHELSLGIYAVRATVIPKRVKFRTPQITKAPVIDGPQTAEIVAPPGSPAEEIHTDKHGRCKVLFHWDRYGKHDDTASCWMRIAQQQTSSSMILPRVGWEVIVEFLEGNPDRPFVTGRVWNGRFMPPYALPEGKSRTALQTASSPGGGGRNEIRMEDKAGAEEVKIGAQKNTTLATGNNKTKSTAVNETKNVGVDATLSVGANQTVKVTNGYKNSVAAAQSSSVGGNRTVEVNAVYGLTAGGASATTVGGNQMEMDGNPIKALLALAVKAATDAAKAQAKQAMAQLDAAVSAKANQVLGPIKDLQAKAEQVHTAMEAVSKGDLSGAAGALGAAAGLPTPSDFGESLLGGGGESTSKGGGGAGDGMAGKASKGGAGGDPGDGGDSGGTAQKQPRGGAAAGGGEPAAGGAPEPLGLDSADHASAALGLDTMVNGAIDAGADALGDALGLDGAGGGGESEANKVGPDGAVGGNSAGDSATGPGHSVNVCSATHAEDVGGLKATIAAAGIHTTIKGARSQKIAAARIELVGGNRVETCLADKTEKAVGLVVVSGSPESEDVGGSRSTMVGGAIIDKVGGTQTVTAGGKAMFVGAFHKIDAGEAIVFKCGSSEVVIDAAGVTIKATLVTITASDIVLTAAVSQA
jgi:type VI secretion system secreted protein VgrG